MTDAASGTPSGGWDRPYRTLLVRCLVALLVGGGLVVLAYHFVDRQVAFFVHDLGLRDHHPRLHAAIRAMTHAAVWLDGAAPVVFALAAVRLAFGPLTRLEWAALAAAINLYVTLVLREQLKSVFGRPWPATWIGDPPANPSLLGDGTYGFFFHGKPTDYYASFPSGHTARTVAVLAVFWVACPCGRWVYALLTALIAGGLVVLNFHFVGDVIGGATLGGITGAYAAHLARLGPGQRPSPAPEAPMQ